jgi:hypothetical protein
MAQDNRYQKNITPFDCLPTTSTQMQVIQNQIVTWQEDVFGQGIKHVTPTIQKLKDEVDELLNDPVSLEEYADCMILLLGAMGRLGIDVQSIFGLIKAKHFVNQARQWGPCDERGVARHVRKHQKKYMEQLMKDRFCQYENMIKQRMVQRITEQENFRHIQKLQDQEDPELEL